MSAFPERFVPASTRGVLVTGGAGFIGAHVVRGLVALGIRAVVVDDLSCGSLGRLRGLPHAVPFHRADVGAPGILAGILAREGPFDHVLHLAARVGVRRVLDDPEGCRASNLAGVRRLVEAIEGLAPAVRPRVVAASTSEVYAEKCAPLREDDPVRPIDGEGRWAYAGSKLLGERLLDSAADLWPVGAAPVHLRFFNVVGPGQDAGAGMVLPTFVEQALAGGPITVHGDGCQVRTLAHVADVADAVAGLLLRRDFPAGALNLGGSARCRVLELADAVARRMPGGPEIRFVDPRRTVSRRFEEVRHREPCLDRARALGLALRTRSLEAIVDDTVEQRLRGGARPPEFLVGVHAPGRSACASPAS